MKHFFIRISAELKSQLQIAIMHVWNSSLCDALHCVSGTLNFITFGKIPFFLHFVLSWEKRVEREGVYHSRMLLERNQKRKREKCATKSDENFIFIERTFQVLLLLCFQHLRNLFPSGSYLCFPMNSHHQNNTIHPFWALPFTNSNKEKYNKGEERKNGF